MLTIETTADFAAEKEYCFHVLFREMLGAEYEVIWKEQADYTVRLPNGNVLIIQDHFFYKTEEGNYRNPQNLPEAVKVISYNNLEIIHLYGNPFVEMDQNAQQHSIRCGSDLFAATFFMLTRWEESATAERDRHGRFPASEAAAVRFGFLDRPVVNEWADLLYEMLVQLGWKQPRPPRRFKLSVSCDVDHPRLWWSVSDRFKTLAGSLFVRGNVKEFSYWLRRYIFRAGDPYDVFEEWMDILDACGLKAHFNFLGERAPSSDCYYPLRHPFVRKTVAKLAKRGQSIGFHPSYEAFENAGLFLRELNSVRDISPVPVTTGRQHYLRFEAPDTWNVWENTGMTWDSTLGYSEADGFRCGICHDFPVFDIVQRKMLNLREKPLIAMDVTLAQYRKYTPEAALEKLQALKHTVRKHQGEFVFLWHNSSWNTYFWEPWKKVFLEFISS